MVSANAVAVQSFFGGDGLAGAVEGALLAVEPPAAGALLSDFAPSEDEPELPAESFLAAALYLSLR